MRTWYRCDHVVVRQQPAKLDQASKLPWQGRQAVAADVKLPQREQVAHSLYTNSPHPSAQAV